MPAETHSSCSPWKGAHLDRAAAATGAQDPRAAPGPAPVPLHWSGWGAPTQDAAGLQPQGCHLPKVPLALQLGRPNRACGRRHPSSRPT